MGQAYPRAGCSGDCLGLVVLDAVTSMVCLVLSHATRMSQMVMRFAQ